MNYQVADAIIRIKNAASAKRRTATLLYSRMNKQLAKILVKEHFLSGVREDAVDGKKVLVVSVAYEKRTPMITDVTVISKPSLRVYSKAKKLGAVNKKGTGVTIVSTNKGVMTETEAVKKSVGGEVLFKIW